MVCLLFNNYWKEEERLMRLSSSEWQIRPDICEGFVLERFLRAAEGSFLQLEIIQSPTLLGPFYIIRHNKNWRVFFFSTHDDQMVKISSAGAACEKQDLVSRVRSIMREDDRTVRPTIDICQQLKLEEEKRRSKPQISRKALPCSQNQI